MEHVEYSYNIKLFNNKDKNLVGMGNMIIVTTYPLESEPGRHLLGR